MIHIYGIKNCDTMKKAMKWLESQNLEYRFHDYRKDGVPVEHLQRWIAELGWETVINQRGTTWRKLPQTEKDHMDAVTAVTAAEQHPALIKRPIVESGKILLAGFNAEQWEQKLKRKS